MLRPPFSISGSGPVALQREPGGGDWKVEATSVVQPGARRGGGGGTFKEDTDRDEQCFALAAELFLTML